MAASDPTPYVATPTGTLQGVAAFSWDGSAWQPFGRAGPDVATSTGVLQGVAPFSYDGTAWQPVGRAQPGVATPSGVLDGVAVYTWSGSAWTPASGTATPATPSGALRGVAAFSWDGAAWQPAAQARASVPTPYGVLAGVAPFNWSGNVWQAGAAVPAGATLDLSFLSGGTLDPRITFTRASTATYFDATGTMQTAASGAPRFDYDPVTHALRGLLLEETRTNLALQSGNAAVWQTASGTVAIPAMTANQIAAPDGTVTGARGVWPAVSGAGVFSFLFLQVTATAAPYTLSMWLRGNVGGEQTYIYITDGTTTNARLLCTLTTAWQRFSVTSGNLTAATWYGEVGVDLRDGGQTSKPAQTIYVWGAQIEAGAFPTSYIPCLGVAVTRAAEVMNMPTTGWINQPAGTLSVEATEVDVPTTSGREFLAMGTAATDCLRVALGGGATSLLTNVFTANVGRGGPTDTAVQAAGVPFKVAATYDTVAPAVKISSAGSVPTSVAVAAYPTMTTLSIGGSGTVSRGGATCGWYRRIRFWPRVLSNAEMQQVTT